MKARSFFWWVTVVAVILLSACANPFSDGSDGSSEPDTTPPGAGEPAAPELLLPADGAADTGNLVTLEWEASAGATSYDVYFGTDSPPAALAADGEGITATELAVSGLSYDTTYSWFVRAKNAEGSADSEVRSFSTTAVDPGAFVTTWQTDAAGDDTVSSDDQIKLPLAAGGTYDFSVDWGDGTSDVVTAADQVLPGETDPVTHTYAASGTYDVTITGTIEGFGFGYATDTDADKLVDVKEWGPVIFRNDGGVFRDADNLPGFSASDSPDLSSVTNMNDMFAGALRFNGTSVGGIRRRLPPWNTCLGK